MKLIAGSSIIAGNKGSFDPYSFGGVIVTTEQGKTLYGINFYRGGVNRDALFAGTYYLLADTPEQVFDWLLRSPIVTTADGTKRIAFDWKEKLYLNMPVYDLRMNCVDYESFKDSVVRNSGDWLHHDLHFFDSFENHTSVKWKVLSEGVTESHLAVLGELGILYHTA